MGEPQAPVPVKLIVGVLTSSVELLGQARGMVQEAYGAIDYESERYAFDLTDYYEPEMGANLGRWFWSFETLIDPGRIAAIKLECNAIEKRLAVDGRRPVNLDPGYLDFHKLVLASVKERAQKIYLSQGIYADPTLYFLKGEFHHYDWSLPDFKHHRYDSVFHAIRNRYREGIKAQLM